MLTTAALHGRVIAMSNTVKTGGIAKSSNFLCFIFNFLKLCNDGLMSLISVAKVFKLALMQG